MRYRTAIMALGVVLLLLVMAVSGSMVIPLSDKGRENSKAPENSPVIGQGFDIERIDFIHYAKPEKPGKPAPETSTCYKLMGVKWTNLPVTYTINPANREELNEAQIISAISTSAETWDNATGKELFNNSYKVGQVTYGILDGKNAIVFGPYSQDNVIAVTSIWYTRRGGQILEFDMLFNEKWVWGDATKNPALMDLQNIATHEFGHTVGLADLYTDSCDLVTMYGYSGNGETEKRTLAEPDITGLTTIYGL
jgi:hypothetical protein